MRGMGGDVADGFVGLLEECEMAKYGVGVVDSRGMQAVYDRALGLLF